MKLKAGLDRADTFRSDSAIIQVPLKKLLGGAAVGILLLGPVSRTRAWIFLFSPNYLPHSYCYLAQPWLIWTNVTMDGLIAASYITIFAWLFWIASKLRTLQELQGYLWILICFGTFILACSGTHLMEVATVWWPVYRLAAAVKVACAAASIATALLFSRAAPMLVERIGQFLETVSLGQQEHASDITRRKEAEEMRERLAAIVDSSDDAIVSWNLEGAIIAWNHGAEKLSGYSAAEALGKPIGILAPAERSGEDYEILERVARGESFEHYETVRLRKDGTRIDVSVTISPIRDPTGRIVGVSRIARDITERKRAEAALQDSEQRFHALANGIPQLAWIANGDGFILWYNRRWYEYTGTTFDEMQGWGWQRLHDPEFLPLVMERWTSAIARGVGFDMEFPLRSATGEFRTFLTRVLPMKDAAGAVVRWFGTNTDISERKEAESRLETQAVELASSRQALERQTLMLQSVLDSIGEGLVAADERGKFILWNPAAEKIVGMGAAPLSPAHWSTHYGVYLPDTVTAFPTEQNPLFRAIAGEVSSAEMILRNPQLGHEVWIECNGTPLRDQDGTARGGVIAFRDITRRKADESEIRRLNEELEQRIAERTAQLQASNRELEAFTYSVSHDLRAPLRHISGFSRILLSEFGPLLTEDANDLLQRIEEAVIRMGRLVDGLLSLARLGRQSLHVRRNEMNAIVDQVIGVLQPDCEGREVEWRVAQLPTLPCDAVLIGQVFQNLLDNALKYSRKRTRTVIEVDSIQRPGEPVVILVRDNGAGFNMKYAEKLFGVFQRMHTETEYEGTGVGLATVHRIIQKHGGTVWAEAEVERGATFYFTVGGSEAVATAQKAATVG